MEMIYDEIDRAILKILYNNMSKPIGYQVLDRKMIVEMNEDFTFTSTLSKKMQKYVELDFFTYQHLKGYTITEKGIEEYLKMIL